VTATTPSGRTSSAPELRPAAFSLSNRLARAMAERNLHYGWVVAGATFIVMLATAGAMGAPGVFIGPLQKEFGWSAADISFALALRLMLFGLMAPFAAAFINRFGVRPVVVAAITMIALGILASLAMTQVWQLVALWGVIVGFGTGMVALVLGATIATRWFAERRGLVVGMLTASNATGQLIFLPLTAKLTQDHGWRTALVFVVAMLSSPALSDCWRCATGRATSGSPPTARARLSRRRSRTCR
jgi:MFS family permease